MPRVSDPSVPADFWPGILFRLTAGQSLSREEAAQALGVIMRGEATPAQTAGLLMALRTKGEVVDELEGFAATALEFARPVRHSGPVLDTCGTGGDRRGTFNVSTLAALVSAAAGATVAKHGNRAASSHCGSADLLEALGVKVDLGPNGVERCMAEAGIGFMFAPVFHPAAAHAMSVRRELRVPTVFNFLGPLTNPARPSAQIVGVSDERMLPLVAEVLARRGTRALVFRSHDGLDELSTTSPALVVEAQGGDVRTYELDPADHGFARATLSDLEGGDVERNAELARAVLDGEPGPKRDVVVLNAAAALQVAGLAESLEAGADLAASAIDAGKAAEVLERWVAVSQQAAEAEASEPAR